MAKYIYWRTSDIETIEKIRLRFGIPKGITINGETRLPPDFDFGQKYLEETRQLGFFDVRCKN